MGEFKDQADLSHLFYPAGKPDGSRSGVANGLQ